MDDLVRFYRECGPLGHIRNFNDKNHSIVIIEMRRVIVSGAVEFEVLRLKESDISPWLSAKTSRPGTRVVFQLLQLAEKTDVDTSYKYLDISQNNFDTVLRKFHLQSLLDYGTTASQVFASATEGAGDSLCTFSVIHVDDYFAMFYRHDHTMELTRGVCWTNDHIGTCLERALDYHRICAGHPLLLNLCMAQALNIATDSRLCTINDEISSIEIRTGFKVWLLAHCKPADSDLHTLSARATGNSTSVAAHRRANRVVKQLLGSVAAFHSHSLSTVDVTDEATKKICDHALLLSQRSDSQLDLLEFLATRVDNQLTAVSVKQSFGDRCMD